MNRNDINTALVVAGLTILVGGGIAISCNMRSECLERVCASGLSPVWLHREAECICAEKPR